MFWQNFLYQCNRIGKSPNAVAAEIGIKSSGSVTRWKNGSAPRDSVLIKLADYFGVSVEELMQDNPPTSIPVPIQEAGNPWAERLRTLTPADLSLFARILESLENNPTGTRAALDLALTAAQSVRQVP